MGLFDRIKRLINQPAAGSVLPSNAEDFNFSVDTPVNNPLSNPPYSPIPENPKSLVVSDYMNELTSYNQYPNPKCNNMNCDLYEGTAVYIKTKRKRKLRAYLFPGESLEKVVADMGFDPETMQIQHIEFDPPTDLQLDSIGRHGNPIPENVCKEDVSAIIDRLMHPDDSILCPDLFRFAEQQRIPLSKFACSRTLDFEARRYLDNESYVAFYLLCVEHDMTCEWKLDKFDYYRSCYDHIMSIDRFKNSFLRGDSNIFELAKARNRNCYIVAKHVILGLE